MTELTHHLSASAAWCVFSIEREKWATAFDEIKESLKLHRGIYHKELQGKWKQRERFADSTINCCVSTWKWMLYSPSSSLCSSALFLFCWKKERRRIECRYFLNNMIFARCCHLSSFLLYDQAPRVLLGGENISCDSCLVIRMFVSLLHSLLLLSMTPSFLSLERYI